MKGIGRYILDIVRSPSKRTFKYPSTIKSNHFCYRRTNMIEYAKFQICQMSNEQGVIANTALLHAGFMLASRWHHASITLPSRWHHATIAQVKFRCSVSLDLLSIVQK